MSQPTHHSGGTTDAAIGLPINFDHFERLDQRQQLFRYAQDLQELLAAQNRLQQRHERVMQFFGRGEQDSDVLLNSVLKSMSLYLVTDSEGLIMQSSPAAERALAQPGRSLIWLPLPQLMHYKDRDRVKGIIQGLTASGASGCLHRDRLFLAGADPTQRGQGYEALALKVGMEIYWLLGQPVEAGADTLKLEQTLTIFGSAQEALVITDASVNIQAVNPAFTRITGYSPAEVIGKNPRMLSSGLQDPPFYRKLWNQLQSNGSWTGELFNRRKNGQIYFEWVTLKEVKNPQNETIAYIAAFSDLSNGAVDDTQYSLHSYTDLLTGLANRRLFDVRLMQALSDAIRNKAGVCVLWVCLERFDEVARDLGYEAGDLLLRACGKRLQELTPGNTVARAGGGDFLLLLPSQPDLADAQGLAQRIRQALAEPFGLPKGKAVLNSVSVGSACYPKDGATVEELLRIANAEMHYHSPIMAFVNEHPDARLPAACSLRPHIPDDANSQAPKEDVLDPSRVRDARP